MGQAIRVSNATGMDNPNAIKNYGCVIAVDLNDNLYIAWAGDVSGVGYYQVWCTQYNGTVWGTPLQVSQGAAEV